jgi:hypothetical protein
MVTLVSPNVDVTIIDESFYIPGQAASVPLIFIATADEKSQPNGDPAIGTYEYGVVRTATSINQLVQLYGIPRYLAGPDGQPYYGDCRNEYGLDQAAKALEILNRVYVIRANVNLNDSYDNIVDLWDKKISDSGDLLNQLVTNYIAEYNAANGLVPADSDYKTTVTKSELKTLADDALVDTLASYSFSSEDFKRDFIQDHTIDHAGFQDVIYTSVAGYIQTTDITGLQNDATVYGFELHLVSINGSQNLQIQVQGLNCQTFGDLIAELQTQIQSASSSNTTVDLIQGRIRITSDLLGATSAVEILSDGFSGVNVLFANTNLFQKFDTPVPGSGIHSLDIYNDDFTVVIGSYDGLDGIIDNWTSGSVVSTAFTPQEAEGVLLTAGADFEHTKEFLNETSLGANDAARRAAIVKQLQAVINSPSSGIRSAAYEYNIVTCAGFPEVTDELLRLSQAVKEEVFVIGETPFDKPPTGPNSIAEWATTPAKVVSYSVAYYYPHGLTSNLDGADILTTAAALALRVYAYNDQQAAVWFAPAGIQRGAVPEATTIGYVSGILGGPTEFVTDYIDDGTSDVLYEAPKQINPIRFIPGRGILVMGQKTTYGASSALDRVNVSRLVKFIKRELRKGLFPYLFEPNDELTRQNVQSTVNSFLGTLVGRRALYDFASICDDTNNTPDTIDRNELWVEVAIKPVKAVEFIYVPVTVVNTGTDIGGRTISG